MNLRRVRPVALNLRGVVDMKTPSTRFHEVFDAYHDRLRRFIVVTLKNDWGADDILQETFLRAHSKLDTLLDEEKLGAWLFRIAYRLCIDHFRKEQRHSTKPLAEDGETIETPDTVATDTALSRHQMNICIQNQVLHLPEHYRSVVWLFDVLGFTQKETAEVLGLSLENVKVRLHRARKKLKAILEQNCSFEKDERNVLICEPREGVDWRGPSGCAGDLPVAILPGMGSAIKKR